MFREFGLPVPVEAQDRTHVYHLYILRFAQRDQVQRVLKEKGISSAVYYPQPLHLADPCRELGYSVDQFPVAEAASRELLAVPIFPGMSNSQVEEIIDAVVNVYSL